MSKKNKIAGTVSADLPVAGSRPLGGETAREYQPIKWLGAISLALLSALLLPLCFPYFNLSQLVWIVLIPLLLAVRCQGAKRGAVVMWLFGWLYGCLSMHWLSRFGLIAPIGAALIRSALFAVCGAYLGSIKPKNGAVYVLSVACAWVSLEYFLSTGSLGMAWGLLCNTQARWPVMLQVTSLFGPWILTLTIALVNAALAQIVWVCWRRRNVDNVGLLRRVRAVCAPLVVSLAVVVVIIAFGCWRLDTYDKTAGRSLQIGLVQLSVPQNEKFDPDIAPVTMGKLKEMSREAVERGADLVVWPETSVPYVNFLKKRSKMRTFVKFIRDLGKPIIVGSIAYDNGREHMYNRMTAFNHRGRVCGSYDKNHLVPFGEYLPCEECWPDWQALKQIPRYARGENVPYLSVDRVKAGMLICFESMVTDVPRRHVFEGAELLLVPTNDAWFGHSSELPGHFELIAMRAVETGRYVAQLGNTGITGVATSWGEIVSQSQIEENTVMVEEMRARTDKTLYVRMGDVLPPLALLWCFLVLVDRWRRPNYFTCER